MFGLFWRSALPRAAQRAVVCFHTDSLFHDFYQDHVANYGRGEAGNEDGRAASVTNLMSRQRLKRPANFCLLIGLLCHLI